MNDLPKTMGYYGGKVKGGKASWIIGLLPPADTPQCYVEPYGGMAGVMMARAPVNTEVYNDLNKRLVNWWRCVRDMPKEFGWLVENTPPSLDLFTEAIADLDNLSIPPIRRALAFHIVLSKRINAGDGGNIAPTDWRLCLNEKNRESNWDMARIDRLSKRMRGVQIDNEPAVDLLDRIADREYAVVYVDPPYPTATTTPYLHSDVDKDALTEALTRQRGFVAVSGYGDEWEHLGWRREVMLSNRTNIKGARGEPRTEVLWLNREPPQRLF